MVSTVLTIIFYIVLITAAFIAGRWLENHERNY
jgi:hypothetical protein